MTRALKSLPRPRNMRNYSLFREYHIILVVLRFRAIEREKHNVKHQCHLWISAYLS